MFKTKQVYAPSPVAAGNAPPIHALIRSAEVKELRRLADRTPAPALAAMLTGTDALGRNALHVAADLAHEDTLKTVLKLLPAKLLPALLGARDANGATPLFLAVRHGSKAATKELLKADADPTLTDTLGNSLLHAPFLAPFLSKGHYSVIKLLLSRGDINVNSQNSARVTPLQVACAKGAYDCAKLLLAAKADPTLVLGGEPPLFSAVVCDNPAMVRILLEAGADVAQTNASGQALMEVVNPKCEIYRIIKHFLINRPGGLRKLQLISEEVIVATGVSDLPHDVQRLVERSGLSHTEIEAAWPTFVSIVRLVAKKRVAASAEEAARIAERQDSERDKVDRSQELACMASQLLTPGNPKKVFTKMRVAGGGGFGMVFQGTGPDKRHWAIKRMAHNSNSEKMANLREANFLKELSHKNVCSYKATYECQAQHELWLVMELLEGGTIDEAIGSSEDATHFFEERHLAFAALEIMRALEYLHSHSVVHRDLKSANIMFTLSGEIKLIDFGAAVSIADTTVVHRDMIGSPYWMAPEMILREPHSWQVDVWGVAVCLLELANHRPPDNSSVLRHLFYTATGKRPWLDRPDNWSDLMRDFLDQCLQFEPHRRPRAAVLVRHKWLTTKACSQNEMSRILQKIFACRAYGDV